MLLYETIDASQAPRSPVDSGALGFLYYKGGVNNQKMAIAGLLLTAIARRQRVSLPYIFLWDQVRGGDFLTPFANIFAPEPLRRFAEQMQIALADEPPVDDRGEWTYLRGFSELLATNSSRIVVMTVLQAVACLRPRIATHALFERLRNHVHTALGIRAAIQLRIEHDWIEYAPYLRSQVGDHNEDLDLDFVGILSKVKAARPDLRIAYVTCDEGALPTPKHEIRALARSRFDIDLVWKSDFLGEAELRTLTSVDQSLIDFEIARSCERFFGLTRSTFANMLCLETFATTGKDVAGHYIYNNIGPAAVPRRDNGFAVMAARAVMDNPVAALVLDEPRGGDAGPIASMRPEADGA